MTGIKTVKKFISFYFTDLFWGAALQIVVLVAEGMVEGEINEGEVKGRREPPKLVLPLVKMYVWLP